MTKQTEKDIRTTAKIMTSQELEDAIALTKYQLKILTAELMSRKTAPKEAVA